MFEYRVVWRRADGSEVVSAVMSLATAQEYAVMPTTSGTGTIQRRQIGDWEDEATIDARAEFLAAIDDMG